MALVSLTGWVLLKSQAPEFDDAWTHGLALPLEIQPFEASEPLFCTNSVCLTVFSSGELSVDAPCSQCGQHLSTRSLGEHRSLPNDTSMWKKRYDLDRRESYFVSLVLGGVTKSSIHRPEVCLVAQGHTIIGEHVEWLALRDGKRVEIKILDLKKRGANAHESTYAYWFFQDGRHTAHHTERVWTSMREGVLKNRWTPWAYMAVHTSSIQNPQERKDLLMTFLLKLHTSVETGRQTAQ